jgi:flagellar FliL protein
MDKLKRAAIIVLMIIVPIVVGGLVYVMYTLSLLPMKPKNGYNKNNNNAAVAQAKEYTYPLGEFQVNLDEPGYRRYVKVTVHAGFRNQKLEEELSDKDVDVQTRSAITSILRSKKVEDLKSVEGCENVQKEIMEKINTIIKTDKIDNVYFTDILIQ